MMPDIDNLPNWVDFDSSDYFFNKQLSDNESKAKCWPLYKELIESKTKANHNNVFWPENIRAVAV